MRIGSSLIGWKSQKTTERKGTGLWRMTAICILLQYFGTLKESDCRVSLFLCLYTIQICTSRRSYSLDIDIMLDNTLLWHAKKPLNMPNLKSNLEYPNSVRNLIHTSAFLVRFGNDNLSKWVIFTHEDFAGSCEGQWTSLLHQVFEFEGGGSSKSFLCSSSICFGHNLLTPSKWPTPVHSRRPLRNNSFPLVFTRKSSQLWKERIPRPWDRLISQVALLMLWKASE